MRTLVFDEQAVADLESQRQYLIDRDVLDAADKLELTIVQHLASTVALFPEIGHPAGVPELWECYIPGTNWVAWYIFTEAELIVVDLWHTSQDRSLHTTD